MDISASSAVKPVSYKSTINASYIGFLVQAIVVNLTPIMFIPLREAFGLSYEQLGLLVFINFTTQVLCDIAFSNLVDRHGFRPFVVTAHALTVAGFVVFAASPLLFARNPYVGFIIGTVIFAGSGGLLELLLSPIVNAIPTDEKASAMAVLHSFYAWGQLSVILITTLLLYAFGKDAWWWVMLLWTLPAVFNFFLFQRVPLAPPVAEEHRQGMRMLITKPFFVVAFLAILMGGAAENSISQWTSAFMEKAVQLPKVVGDVAGFSMFAAMLGVGRLLYGIYGKRVSIQKVMLLGTVLATVCYLTVALAENTVVILIACALCGFAVSLLWPGTLVIAAEQFPLAGTWLFAILAAGGDIGASVGPLLISVVTDNITRISWFTQLPLFAGLNLEQIGLRLGMVSGTIFPIGALLCLVWLLRAKKKDFTAKA